MYPQMTEHLRGQESRLLISYVAPYKGVSKDTISRWMKTIMTASGIDTSFFKPHSVRLAFVSAVSDKGLPHFNNTFREEYISFVY
jgi:site-specific recombinase XerD